MKVLVTGATGFIGNYVVNELLRRNCEVVATSRTPPDEKVEWLPKVIYKPLDISNTNNNENLFEYFEQPNCLIHLAWEGLPNYKSEHHLTHNLPSQKWFVEKLISEGVKNINIIGTCFEYGMQEGELKEDVLAIPDNPYAKAKNELRIFVEDLSKEFSFSFKWLRLFYMYGKGQAANSLIPQLEAALEKGDASFNMSGGEQVRDFLPVKKVATYIVDTALQNEMNGVINICSNQPVSVKEFVLNYLEQKNKTIRLNLGYYPYADFEPMRFWGNNEKLKSIQKK
ncbi:MAG: SDR family oxidoreductase [Niabella sp.]|nr:MAG: SDR family oxidoreductase [Niabella sp.]